MNSPESSRHLLSKSTFMMGHQCPKRLWLFKNKPELRQEISDAQQMIFNKGTNTGLLAQQLFPGGKDASPVDYFSYPQAIRQTYDWITNGETIIYEAAFQFDRVMAALDILVSKKGKWYAYEVKSSTEVKEQFIMDAALQYYVITNAGLPLADISIFHLNNQYVRQGELDLQQLFSNVSIKKEVLALQPAIQNWVAENKKVLLLKKEPVKDIGSYCNVPYECEFMDHCWSHIPDISVFNLTRLNGDKKFELYYKGVVELQQLPKGYALTASQQLQVKAYLQNYTHIEPGNIRDWLGQLEYPLFYMDFETFMPGVPLYNNSRPYQQIPFQFSAHQQNAENGPVTHSAFLGVPETDPREEFLVQLIKATKGKGSVLVYNKAFESTRLKELQADFPCYNAQIEDIQSRIIDLMEPFQKKWYYTPQMNGSYSIKAVLPALVPEMSYANLEIGEGGTAMAAFEGLLNIKDETEKQKIRNALLEYCKLDTEAMVRILEKLKSI